ncbi:MAG TPA: hypothetical protein VK653_09195 [Xanthobacteraceae bacterium]|nr:hypothetical protein [Xanthobacteraceae bacterium]
MADEIWQASSFCPEGYVSTPQAILRAAQFWFPEQYDAAVRAVGSTSAGTNGKIDRSVEPLARALSPQFLDAFVYTVGELVVTTVQRLRNFLYQGTIDTVYFTRDGAQRVDEKFWATTEADGILELGTYWPFGKPNRWYEARPNYPLFIKQSKLDALLSEERAGRKFPIQKKSELAAAYRDPTIASLPTRKAQREAIKTLEQFKSYQITHRLFRDAERASGKRQAGVKKQKTD